jgi:DNA invertase Pin-like site-specific DNA recombinase
MSIIGYARVSTQDQDLTAQLAALKTAGTGTIYREKISGVRADRLQLARMVAALSAVTSLSSPGSIGSAAACVNC